LTTEERTIEELKSKIAEAEEAGNNILVKAYSAKLAQLEGKETLIGTGMTAGEYEEAPSEPTFVSSFPSKGDWVGLFYFPYDDIITAQDGTEYNVIRFPFHVPAPGYEIPFMERDDSVIHFKGTPKEGYHSPIKGTLQALNVPYTVNKKGEVVFNPADVEGKVGTVLYRVRRGATYIDPLTDEEKPSTIANARAVVALGSETEAEAGDIPF